MERSITELLFVCLRDAMVNTVDKIHSMILKAFFSDSQNPKSVNLFPCTQLVVCSIRQPGSSRLIFIHNLGHTVNLIFVLLEF